MHQLTQTLKNGEMRVLEVPFPALDPGCVLVRTHYSLISTGTEGKTVRDARLGYLGKAKTRQKELRQVIDSVRTDGLRATYDLVMKKLEAPSALGYSCAGEVLAVGEGVDTFHVGDRVACGGSGAVHAEVVAVPKNLCVKVPEGVDLRHAAFTTVAAIALQGIRQAELNLGACGVVTGLGLVGLLTVQLLEAAGVRVIGIDLDPARVRLAREVGASLALERNMEGVEEAVHEYTHGMGADAVLITAGTSSLDPVELAGRLCRKKGRVVVVGSVPTGFSREAYYRKELDLRMSCSYGPGRYDPQYEEKGLDYPVGYVRWTENRNMQAIQDLLQARKLNLEPLITHTFDLEEAPLAYEVILGSGEAFAGVLLRYDTEKSLERRVQVRGQEVPSSEVTIGFVGAGSFAQNVLLPALKKEQGHLVGVATARPNNARYVADTYEFQYCTGNAEEVIADDRIKVIFIVTRHDQHAPYVLKALQQGKNVFVEKPLCMTGEQLEEIREAYEAQSVHLMVGYNRRFAPHVQEVLRRIPQSLPRAINYRVNAGILPPDHWMHDREIGGGRIIGEVCHFVDLASYIAGAPVEQVSANVLRDSGGRNDTVTVSLGFANGSTAAISYFSNGNRSLRKEYLEVFSGGHVAVIDDFRRLTVYGDKTHTDKLRRQDKGHHAEVKQFLEAVRRGGATPIPFEQIYNSTLATFAILESIQEQRVIRL